MKTCRVISDQISSEFYIQNVQIFRNENGKWHETVSSDKLTLKQQQQINSAAAENINHDL